MTAFAFGPPTGNSSGRKHTTDAKSASEQVSRRSGWPDWRLFGTFVVLALFRFLIESDVFNFSRI